MPTALPEPDPDMDYGEWADNGETVTYYFHSDTLVQTETTGEKPFRPDRNNSWGTFDNSSQHWLVDGLTGDSFYIDGGADIDTVSYTHLYE